MVTIREARLADSEALADLASQLGYPVPAAEIGRRLAALEQSALLVALCGDAVRGFVQVGRKDTILVEPTAELGGLIVDQGHRGRGLGRALLRAAEQWGLEHGCEQMDISTNVVRTGARLFYARMGYQAYKESVRFRKRLPPEA